MHTNRERNIRKDMMDFHCYLPVCSKRKFFLWRTCFHSFLSASLFCTLPVHHEHFPNFDVICTRMPSTDPTQTSDQRSLLRPRHKSVTERRENKMTKVPTGRFWRWAAAVAFLRGWGFKKKKRRSWVDLPLHSTDTKSHVELNLPRLGLDGWFVWGKKISLDRKIKGSLCHCVTFGVFVVILIGKLTQSPSKLDLNSLPG